MKMFKVTEGTPEDLTKAIQTFIQQAVIIGEYELLAFKNVKKVNIFSRLIKSFNYLIWGDV